MGNFIYKSAIELASLIQKGKATSLEIVIDHLERIKKHNGKLNAMISVFEEEALQEAKKCDLEFKEGKFRGQLHGVPVTIKEPFWIKGKHSNANYKKFKDFVAPEDAVVVDRIKKSGAIIIGQTNVPKKLFDYQVKGDIYPDGKNPYNPDYTPGGSTGGGASALAAGFTPLELGSDFGGSIRVPSNFCGLYGLKPTDKTVPLHGNMPLPKNANTFIAHMFQAGPLARNVADLELLWKTIVGPHESDRNIPDINWKPPAKNSPSDYKIAYTDGWPGYETSVLVRNKTLELSNNLKSNGYNVEQAIPDDTLHFESLKVFLRLAGYVIAQGTPWFVRVIIKMQLLGGLLKGIKESPQLAKTLKKAWKFHVNDYGEAMLLRSILIQGWEKFFNKYDFLICPLTFGPAYKRCKIGSKLSYEGNKINYVNYAWPYVACFSASGHPSMAIPLGLSPEGLPIGVQIVGKYWSEPELIHFAKKIEKLTDGFVKPLRF